MPITLLVRSGGPEGAPPTLTFDGDRIVIGRSSGCDVRLPDPSVTLRHASVRATRAEYTLVDEGSTNGTFVGGERLPPHTPRTLRSGDLVRVGRVWLEVRIEQAAPTPDLALATRDMALALVSQALVRLGNDVTVKIHVVQGRDAGLVVPLHDEGRVYVFGRSDTCDVPLLDTDVSREHAQFVRRGATVLVRDLGSKNGVLFNGARLPVGRDVPWRGGALRMGNTALALVEPVSEALTQLEQTADEILVPEDIPPPPEPLKDARPSSERVSTDELAAPPPGLGVSSAPTDHPLNDAAPQKPRERESAWTGTDLAVMFAAVVVLASSVAGLVWLLRG